MIPEHALARATAQKGMAVVEARAKRDMCPMCGEVQTVACAGGLGVRGQCERCGHELAVDDSLLMLLGNGCLHVCAHVCACMCSVYLSVSVTVSVTVSVPDSCKERCWHHLLENTHTPEHSSSAYIGLRMTAQAGRCHVTPRSIVISSM